MNIYYTYMKFPSLSLSVFLHWKLTWLSGPDLLFDTHSKLPLLWEVNLCINTYLRGGAWAKCRVKCNLKVQIDKENRERHVWITTSSHVISSHAKLPFNRERHCVPASSLSHSKSLQNTWKRLMCDRRN